MERRALLVGIDVYDNFSSIDGCVFDAHEMAKTLSRHDNCSPNFDCKLLTSQGERVTRSELRKNWNELSRNFTGDLLFYFSGHGAPSRTGAYMVTQDGDEHDLGMPMQELFDTVNNSDARTALFILDCCFSGSAGNPAFLKDDSFVNKAMLREGVTILTASRTNQEAFQIDGHGAFTKLVLGALRGGGANVLGHVSAASIYAYVEAALVDWSQRPLYKSHASKLEPVRICKPVVPLEVLRELPSFFPQASFRFQLDPTYEEENQDVAIPENIKTFRKFKRYQIAGLLMPENGEDLFWAAQRSEHVVLTDLGRFYLKLLKEGRI